MTINIFLWPMIGLIKMIDTDVSWQYIWENKSAEISVFSHFTISLFFVPSFIVTKSSGKIIIDTISRICLQRSDVTWKVSLALCAVRLLRLDTPGEKGTKYKLCSIKVIFLLNVQWSEKKIKWPRAINRQNYM